MSASYDHLLNVVTQITKWAQAKNMFGDARVEPGYDEALIQSAFRGPGLHAATTALQDRRIAYIGLNEANSTVVVYLERAFRAKDREALSNVGVGDVAIEFLNGAQLTSGTQPANSPSVPPFDLWTNGTYTCGSSVSIANEQSAGTLGCLLTDAAGDVFALSNNHVFAGNNYCDIGMPIIAPGQFDIKANSLDPFTIGHLHSAIPLIDGNPQIVDCSTNVDAAIIRIADPQKVTSMQRTHYDTPAGILPISGNMVVEKVGRTTGRTTGIITSYHPTPQEIRVNIMRHGSFKWVSFQDYWAVQSQAGAFSSNGDSGSLVTTKDPADGAQKAVGIVFAGGPVSGGGNLSFIIPLDKILTHFNLTLLGGHNI